MALSRIGLQLPNKLTKKAPFIRAFSFSTKLYNASNDLKHTNASIKYEPPDMTKVDEKTWPSSYTKDTQEEIKEYLDWKMTDDWKKMSPLDQKMTYFLAFGEHGPRSKKGGNQTPIERLFETIYKSILFGALAVSVYQFFKDKKINEKIDYLEKQL